MLQIPSVGVARYRASRAKNFLSLLYIGMGSLFELYDFVLFAVLMPVIAPLFFPSDTSQGSVLLGYLAFGVAFVMALFGSVIWGKIGDKKGSSVIFKASILLMAIPSLSIAFLPTYESIGILSPIALMCLRLIQGFSISGEALGAKIYAFERFGERRYLAASSFISAFGAMGVLLAMCAGGYVVSHTEDITLWRKAFFFGGAAMLLISILRLLFIVDSKSAITSPNQSLIDLILKDKKRSIEAFVASIMLGVLSYFMHGFLINYLMLMGLDVIASVSLAQIGLIGTICCALLIFIFSLCGLARAVSLQDLALFVSIISLPLIFSMQSEVYFIKVAAIFIMGCVLGLYASIAAIKVVMSFKDGERCRGSLFLNALGVSVFGGFTPLVMSLFASVNLWLPAFVFSGCFLMCYFILKRA